MISSAEKEEVDIVDVIGSFGPFQAKIAVLLFLFNIIGSWHSFSVTFQAPNTDFYCVPPEYELDQENQSVIISNYSTQNASGLTVSYGNGSDQCHMTMTSNGFTGNITASVVPCKKWKYDLSFYEDTIISEWDLVCDREWLISLAKSMYMFGFMASMVFCGQMSDCIGRYPTMMLCYIILTAAALLSVISSNYLMFVILRFLEAFGGTGLKTTGYILLMEIIGPDMRTLLGIVLQVGGIVGSLILTPVAYLVRPWFLLQLAMAVPILPLACVWCIVTESPRWLRAQGKMMKLRKVLRKACRQNGRDSESEIAHLMSLEIKVL